MKSLERHQVRSRNGVEAKEIPVALDGLAVYISKSNPVQSLTMLQLKAIYTGKIANWREVGGENVAIVAYGRDNNSGTNQFFREHVLNNEEYASKIRILPGTSAIVRAISKDPSSIGYGGIAYASGIRVVPVRRDDRSEPVMPTLDTVKSGQYALSRYLFFYTRGDPSGDLKLFVDWVLGAEGQELCTKVGYYPILRN
jgi:phosphate transport system substrate-binding protein